MQYGPEWLPYLSQTLQPVAGQMWFVPLMLPQRPPQGTGAGDGDGDGDGEGDGGEGEGDGGSTMQSGYPEYPGAHVLHICPVSFANPSWHCWLCWLVGCVGRFHGLRLSVGGRTHTHTHTHTQHTTSEWIGTLPYSALVVVAVAIKADRITFGVPSAVTGRICRAARTPPPMCGRDTQEDDHCQIQRMSSHVCSAMRRIYFESLITRYLSRYCDGLVQETAVGNRPGLQP